MKTHVLKTCLLMAVLIAVINPTLAQSKKGIDPRDLIGTWELDFDKSIGQIKSKSKSHYDGLKNDRRDRIKNSFSQRKVTFGSGGSYVLDVRSDRQVTGTWKLVGDDTLLISLNDGSEHYQKIEKVNPVSLTLNLGGAETKNRLFDKWSLKRSKN